MLNLKIVLNNPSAALCRLAMETMMVQELRAHHKILQQELALYARMKRKMDKKVRGIDNLAEVMNNRGDTRAVLEILSKEKEGEVLEHNIYMDLDNRMSMERLNITDQIETHALYVENVRENANLFPGDDEGLKWNWSVEGWRTRTKPHKKFWRNGIIIPMYFWY